MYIAEVPTKTKKGKISHTCYLLRESYRKDGKVNTRTVANITHCDPKEIEAIRFGLKYKNDLDSLKSLTSPKDIELEQGMSIGAVWLIYDVARKLGIEKALGTEKEGKLALWQIIARVIDQGSRLSAVRLASVHAACDILGIKESFYEEDLYKNLNWLSENQDQIEDHLFKNNSKGKKPELFLYDVTSSYMEGDHNDLAERGYNRDKKSGKKQVVVGLLCNEDGDPVSVEVFNGNTLDFETFGNQIKKVAERFGCSRVTFVGDRGMIKSKQIQELELEEFYYITAITKPQINKLVKEELFDKDICEREYDGVRYILRKNPHRVQELSDTRKEKNEVIENLCQEKNKYLSEHPRAQVKVAKKEVKEKIECLKLDGWLKVRYSGRELFLEQDKEALENESKLDGCYVIKSNLPSDIDKQVIHDRYKDLTEVEQGFRTCKTEVLELRPWYVRREKSTRGHTFVVMLAYKIIRHLRKAWEGFNLTVKEGIDQLSMLCSIGVLIKGEGFCHKIPRPLSSFKELFSSAKVRLPKILPHLGVKIVSRKKINEQRKSQDKTTSFKGVNE
jgi:transposase